MIGDEIEGMSVVVVMIVTVMAGLLLNRHSVARGSSYNFLAGN